MLSLKCVHVHVCNKVFHFFRNSVLKNQCTSQSLSINGDLKIHGKSSSDGAKYTVRHQARKGYSCNLELCISNLFKFEKSFQYVHNYEHRRRLKHFSLGKEGKES